jgi:pyridoxamine 5'-phosphate oxidase
MPRGYHAGVTRHEEQLPDPLPAEPLGVVARWLEEAAQARTQPNPNAMVLATVDSQGRPSARVVLCKDIRPQPGYVSFYSNYQSRKASDLAANPHAAIVMHWDPMHRQVRIEGQVVQSTGAESDSYFASRAWQSRIGAWASQQSTPLASRAVLAAAVDEVAKRFGVPSPHQSDETAPDPGVFIPRPPHWGGWHLWAQTVELWVQGSARLHDRARWTRSLARNATAFDAGSWSSTRLNP